MPIQQIVFRRVRTNTPASINAETGEEIPAAWHWETIAETKPVYAAVTVDAPDEEEAELSNSSILSIEQQINLLKEQLSSTDYKAIKYAEGWITEEDYAPIKAERQLLRDEINRLESNIVLE